jgi:hypothetical protein
MAQCTNTPPASPPVAADNNDQSLGKSNQFRDFKAKVAATKLDAFYDTQRKEFLTKNAAGRWHAYNEAQFKRTLRAKGISSTRPDKALTAPAEDVMLAIQDQHDVAYAGALAGRQQRFYDENGLRFLVTSSPLIIKAQKRTWDTLNTFLANLLAGPDEPYADQQWITFNGWLSTARRSLKEGRFQPGQALAIAGVIESGKSLLQGLITQVLGGRSAKAAMWLQGRTDFNSELFGAEHLMLEDESASTSHAARMALATAIKSMVANRFHPCHAKRRDIVNLAPWWRLTISLNDEPEHMLVLPPINADMADKIILLRATKDEMPMPTVTAEQQETYWARLMEELPGYMWWLENEFTIPKEYLSTRFGVSAFHHPALLEALDELSPAFRMLGLIDLAKPWGTGIEWKGTADTLRALLLNNPTTQRDASKLLEFPDRCGRYLGELSRKRPARVQNARTEDVRNWVVYPPVSYGRK